MNGSGTSGGGGGLPSVGRRRRRLAARSMLARRSATVARWSPPSAERGDDLVAVEEEDVVGLVDDALGHEPLADGEAEPAEHADEELVDVEGVVLGEREAVAGRARRARRTWPASRARRPAWPGPRRAAPRAGRPSAGRRPRGPRSRRAPSCWRCSPAGSTGSPARARRRGRRRRRGASRSRTGTRRAAAGTPGPPRWRRALPGRSSGAVVSNSSFSAGLARTVRLSAHSPRLASTEVVGKPWSVWYDSVGSSGRMIAS